MLVIQNIYREERIMYCINDDASILYYKKEKSNKREMPARGKYIKNK